LDNECGDAFTNITASNDYVLLDGLLLDVKIMESLEKTEVPEEVFDDIYEIFNLHSREKKYRRKMLSETKDSLLDLDKCSLHELIDIFQKFSNDSSINVHQKDLALT
jgi:hypothetical protein